MSRSLDQLLKEIEACRICREATRRKPLPHEPRPVLRVATQARIAICGQAPGARVHASGKPFTDPSGHRLRDWMGVDEEIFYDTSRIAIIPMGFCFPGLDAKGGDLPPRPECAPQWRKRVMAELAELRLVLLVGSYAIKWHLGKLAKDSLTETVAHWRDYSSSKSEVLIDRQPQFFPLPHPSWSNNAWLKRNAWFEADLLPELRSSIAGQLEVD